MEKVTEQSMEEEEKVEDYMGQYQLQEQESKDQSIDHNGVNESALKLTL